MPRDLTDLPYAAALAQLDEPLAPDEEYRHVLVDGTAVDQIWAGGSEFTESALTNVVCTGGSVQQSRLSEVWMRGVRWIGLDASETRWTDVEIVDSAWSGVVAVDARLRRVRFEGCKFESVNFRAAKLQEVSFVDCVLRDTDFSRAGLRRISFPGSRLEGVALHGAALQDLDLREAVTLDLIGDIGALKGAVITTGQLMDLAPAFARAAGIIVNDN
ncbi:pentapeptide repeat-containing protein [Nocardia vermiculata]|uniref:Pentapeptide repeat-containing protein n=1 Tax=Nocardia vermiculata TaxID=257274 RepID=A0A846Y5Z4_9NOCA|nr:pentapeptide repeat-containing protein [Nocardia vermiculata]NKY52109.1 pentapeptide repeat-containing protein [Nocardia vermiculata]